MRARLLIEESQWQYEVWICFRWPATWVSSVPQNICHQGRPQQAPHRSHWWAQLQVRGVWQTVQTNRTCARTSQDSQCWTTISLHCLRQIFQDQCKNPCRLPLSFHPHHPYFLPKAMIHFQWQPYDYMVYAVVNHWPWSHHLATDCVM